MPEKSVELTKEFKTYHVTLIDQTEGEEALEEEQKMLDAFEDKIEQLNDHLELSIGQPVGMESLIGMVPSTS